MQGRRHSFRSPVPVVVTGTGGGGHGEQIVKALRLGTLDYHIIGTDISALSTGSQLVDCFRILPQASSPHYMEQLISLVKETGARALFHGSEAEMRVFSEHRAMLEELGVFVPVNPPDVLAICQDKVSTCAFLKEQGFDYPEFREISRPADLLDFFSFPVVVKPAIGGGGSANVYIAQDQEELRLVGSYLLRHCPKVSVQVYVGTPDQEYTVGVLFGRDGTLIDSIAVRRMIGNALSVRMRVSNRTGRSEFGQTLVISSGISQGEVGRWPEVSKQCELIAMALHPQAPINIQCRLVKGAVVPFEINPRFSGTTSVRAMCGYNEPDVLVRREVFGDREARPNYLGAVVLRSLNEIVIPDGVDQLSTGR